MNLFRFKWGSKEVDTVFVKSRDHADSAELYQTETPLNLKQTPNELKLVRNELM